MSSFPIRTCLGCGSKALKSTLVRLATRGGRVVIDTKNRLSGRGVYCCRNAYCFARVQRKNNQLMRAFRVQQISWDSDIRLFEELFPTQPEGTESQE